MSETNVTTDTTTKPTAGLVDLTELRMMPAWVAGMGSASFDTKYEDRGERDERASARGQRPGGRDRRDGPPQRRDGSGRTGDSRPRGEKRDGPMGDRRDRRDGPRPPRGRDQAAPPRERTLEVPNDIKVIIEPRDSAAEVLATHIRSTGHAFSMFDAARLVLADGERFQVRFTCASERAQGLFQTPANGGLYLSREEALSRVLSGSAIELYYRSEEIELEEPKGDFKAIGVCGISGELLGPPNHHSFQSTLLRLHRERFSNMPLEDYKRRVRTETGEEIVTRWKEQQRKGQRWVYVKDQPEGAEPITFSTRAEMESHFRRTHGADACAEVREAIFTGNPEKTRISPPLFFLARNAVDAARKHLFEMSQKLGSGFERRGLKLFKRRAGKLYVSRIKPRIIDPDLVFSERVTRVVSALKGAQGIALHDLLEKIVPTPASTPATEAPAADATPAPAAKTQLSDEQIAVLKDIRWLANEGYVIEYSDGMIFLGIQGEPASAKPKPSAVPDAKATQAPVVENAAPAEENDPLAEENDPLAEENDSLAEENDSLAEENDPPAEENDPPAEENDSLAEENDPLAEENDSLAEENDSLAEENDSPAEENDPLAEENDSPAEENDPLAEENDPLAEENDPPAQEKAADSAPQS